MSLCLVVVSLLAFSTSCYGTPVPEVADAWSSQNAMQMPIGSHKNYVREADSAPTKRNTDLVVNVCFTFDQSAAALIETDVSVFLTRTVEVASKYMKANLDPRISLRFREKGYFFLGRIIHWGTHPYSFNDKKYTSGAVMEVARRLFESTIKINGEDVQYFNWMRGRGCDAGFLLIQPRDTIWKQTAGVTGKANTYGMCRLDSIGVMQLKRNVDYMGNILGHEIGHLVGIQHDGPLVDKFVSFADMWMKKNPTIMTEMQNHCTPAASEERCIMDTVAHKNPDGTYVGCYTRCSKAYFKMWLWLTHDMPDEFSSECLHD